MGGLTSPPRTIAAVEVLNHFITSRVVTSAHEAFPLTRAVAPHDTSYNMRRDVFSTICLVLCNVLPVRAAFSEFFFAGNNGSSNALKTCPDSGFECAPPAICSFDDRTENYYCCIPGFEDAVCWGPSEGCNGGDSTTPAGNQQACGTGINTFCCLESRCVGSYRQQLRALHTDMS